MPIKDSTQISKKRERGRARGSRGSRRTFTFCFKNVTNPMRARTETQQAELKSQSQTKAHCGKKPKHNKTKSNKEKETAQCEKEIVKIQIGNWRAKKEKYERQKLPPKRQLKLRKWKRKCGQSLLGGVSRQQQQPAATATTFPRTIPHVYRFRL